MTFNGARQYLTRSHWQLNIWHRDLSARFTVSRCKEITYIHSTNIDLIAVMSGKHIRCNSHKGFRLRSIERKNSYTGTNLVIHGKSRLRYQRMPCDVDGVTCRLVEAVILCKGVDRQGTKPPIGQSLLRHSLSFRSSGTVLSGLAMEEATWYQWYVQPDIEWTR
jgi:hypothetical protein